MDNKEEIKTSKYLKYIDLIPRILGLIILSIILICILLYITSYLGCVDCGGRFSDPRDNISNSLKASIPNGENLVPKSILLKGVPVKVYDLAMETDLDINSFIFTMGEFTSADGIETDRTYLRYIGTQAQKIISAIVICKPTNSELKQSLSNLDPKYDTSLASNGCVNDGIVCCVIIPTKATN